MTPERPGFRDELLNAVHSTGALLRSIKFTSSDERDNTIALIKDIVSALSMELSSVDAKSVVRSIAESNTDARWVLTYRSIAAVVELATAIDSSLHQLSEIERLLGASIYLQLLSANPMILPQTSRHAAIQHCLSSDPLLRQTSYLIAGKLAASNDEMRSLLETGLTDSAPECRLAAIRSLHLFNYDTIVLRSALQCVLSTVDEQSEAADQARQLLADL